AGPVVAWRENSGGAIAKQAVDDAGMAALPAIPAAKPERKTDEGVGRCVRLDEERQRRDRARLVVALDPQQVRAGLPAAGRVFDYDRQAEADQAAVRGVGEDARRQAAREGHLRQSARRLSSDCAGKRGKDCEMSG